MDPHHHVYAANLAALQYQSGNTQQTSNIPGVSHYNHSHPPTTLPSYPSLHFPPERDIYLDALSLLMNRELHMGFPSQHVSSVARSFTVPESHTAPPSSTTYSPFTPDDDNLLVEAVSQCETDCKNLSVAMTELSGVNGHSTADWVNYYIQNSQRIREKMISEPSRSEWAGEAAPSTLARFESRSVTQAVSRCGNMGRMKLDKVASEELMHPQRIPRGKQAHRCSTLNAESTISWPTPPSRIVRRGSRCRYTTEDMKYMKNFFEIAYKHNRNASDTQICDMLAARAPHHSLFSWRKYRSQNRGILERIRQNIVRGNSDFGTGEESDEQDTKPMQPSTRQPTAEPEVAASILSSVGSPNGVKGTDLRAIKRVANFIASNEGWHSRPQTQMVKWRQFSLRHEPKRTAKAWSEFYMTNREDIDRWVRQIARGEKERKEANSKENETYPLSPLGEQLRSSPPSSMARSGRSNSPEL